MIAWTAGNSAGATRSCTGSEVSRSAFAAANSRSRFARSAGRRPTRCSSRAPTSRSFASSSGPCPAFSLTVTACRQVAHGSLQASTRKVHRPGSSGTTVAVNRSTSSRIGAIRTCWPGPSLPTFFHTTFAAIAS